MDTHPRVLTLRRAYRLFGVRDVDGLLALMTDDVAWPDVANGAELRGKEAIRRYWDGQFAISDPRVTPTAFEQDGDDVVAIVEQRILDLQGDVVHGPQVVRHRYSFEGDLVARMVVVD